MFKRALCLLSACFLLSGCAATALVAGAAAGGTLLYDHRSMETILEDKEIQLKVTKTLYDDLQIKRETHITSIVLNHVVLLTGQAPTAALRERAYKLVKSLHHIKHIYNQITIAGPLSNIAQTGDAWITSKVIADMLTIKNLHAAQIKVHTEDNVVYLMGIVEKPQAQLAIEAARRITGVRKVVELFEHPKKH